jgi:hypothetical protein
VARMGLATVKQEIVSILERMNNLKKRYD